MQPASLLDEEPHEIVLDTSTIINLNATGFAEEILTALPHRFLVPLPVVTELESGRAKGYTDATDMFALMDRDIIEPIRMTNEERLAFIGFVSGNAAQSPGDGEAATLALTETGQRWACIDEKKARYLCRRLPASKLISTLDIILHKSVVSRLSEFEIVSCVGAALEVAYMNVQAEHLEWVLTIIPQERLNRCLSLPKRYRVI